MSADWVRVLTELVPLALIFALSPLSLIPVLVTLRSARPRPTGLAFLAGWLLSITALTGLCAELAGRVHLIGTPTGQAWVRLGIGVVLLALGGYRWFRRGYRAAEPEWVHRLSSLTAAPGMITAGVLLLASPVALFLCAAAGAMIGTASPVEQKIWVNALCFAAVAGISVAVPVLLSLVTGGPPAGSFARLRAWVLQRHHLVAAALPVLVGVVLVLRALRQL